jgi:anaerobic magnesium-protoporphyrin IX monomethyl ester cyclase
VSDILLLHPAEYGKTTGGMPPLGMASIASFLQSKNISTTLVDLQVSDRSVEQLLQQHSPHVVGIGGTSHTRFVSYSIARQVKKYDSAIRVVYGGPHATFTAENTLKCIPEIDYIVRGEGESTTYSLAVQLLSGKPEIENIPGISCWHGDAIVHHRDAERIKNLDLLPFPYRDHDTLQKYDLLLDFVNIPAASIISSRGCPINCSFCSASAMFGTQLTLRSAKNVVDEIEILLHEYGYQGIKFFDSTLTLHKNHVEAICAEILKRKLAFPWECEIRVNGVSFDLLQTMKNAGCYYVDFGIESASPRMLSDMHKGITIEQAERVLRWTKDIGLYTKVFFTFGHIGESYEDAMKTVEFMERYASYIDMIAYGIGVRIYPGTEVEQLALAQGLLPKDFSWDRPYLDRRIEALGNDPIIPIVLQTQFSWKEFRRLEFRLTWFWIKHPQAALGALWRQIRLGRIQILAKLAYRFALNLFVK